MATQEYGHTHHGREEEGHVEPVGRAGTHGGVVVLPHEVADTYGHGSSHAREYQVEQLRHGDYYLMGSQLHGAQPAHHDTTEAERGRLHAQLQGHGPP